MREIDIGAYSAYAIAVKHGYQGTEDEWIQEQEANRVAAQNAADSANESMRGAQAAREGAETAERSAADSARSAEQSKNTAVAGATTATNKAAEAEGSAQRAETAAGELEASVNAAAASAQAAKTSEDAAKASEIAAKASEEHAQAVMNSIPDEYSVLSADVSQLKDNVCDLQTVIGKERIEHFNSLLFEACYYVYTSTGVREYNKYSTSIASNDNFFNFEYDVDVYSDVEEGYEFVLFIYNEDGSHNKTYDYSDTTGLVRVPRNTNFRVMFRKKGVSVIDVDDVNAHVFYKYKAVGLEDTVASIEADVEILKTDMNAVNNIANAKTLDPSAFEACYPISSFTGIREYNKYSTSVASNDNFIEITADTTIHSDIDNGYRFACYVYEQNGTFSRLYDYSDTVNGITLKYPDVIRLQINKIGVSVIDVKDVCNHIFFSSNVESAKLTSDRLSQRFTDDIVDHNADMLDAVNAASMYGVHYLEYNSRKCCSMLVTTDIHKSVDRHIAALRYLEAIDSIDIGCCLGDMQAGNYSENDGTWFTSPVSNLSKPYLVAVGNHDCGNGTSGNTSGTTSEVVNKFITPIEGKMGKSNLDVPYYSYDDDAYKMHFIVLYNFDSPDTKDADGNFVFFRGGECLSQAQLDWFASDLNGVKSGYSVVILMHSFWFPNTPMECSFTQPNIKLGGNNRAGYEESDNIIPKIVNAYMNRKTIAETFTPKTEYADILPTLNANFDFTSANGVFVCYLVGHSHTDVVAHSTQYNDQLVIGFCATALDVHQNANSDIPRTIGTKSEDAITVVAFNTGKRRVNMVRIGSNITINMVKRDMISIPY